MSPSFHGNTVPGGTVPAAENRSHGNQKKFLKDVRENDRDVQVIKNAVESGFNVVRVLQNVLGGMGDTQDPDPGEVPLKS